MTLREESELVVRQEPDRLEPRPLAISVGLITLASVIGLMASTCILRTSERGRDLGASPPSATPAQVGTAETTLFVATERGLTQRAQQRASLEIYGWVDRDAGRARIPIERAMGIVVDRAAAEDGGAP
jgi:hypothetical protein